MIHESSIGMNLIWSVWISGGSFWTTPGRGTLCLWPCWSRWEKTWWRTLTRESCASSSYQANAQNESREWSAQTRPSAVTLRLSLQRGGPCFPQVTTSRSWPPPGAATITARCSRPAQRSEVICCTERCVSAQSNCSFLKGHDPDSGSPGAGHRDGERRRHGGGLPVSRQLWYCCRNREIDFRHSWHQRRAVLLHPGSGDRTGAAQKGEVLL